MEKFTSQQVYQATDNAAAHLWYCSIKAKQRAVIEVFVAGKRVLSLPTGYGKSLGYSLLPWVFDELWGEKNTSIVAVCIPFNFSDDQRQKYVPRGLVLSWWYSRGRRC